MECLSFCREHWYNVVSVKKHSHLTTHDSRFTPHDSRFTPHDFTIFPYLSLFLCIFLSRNGRYRTYMNFKAVRLFGVGIIVLLLGLPAFAQNTKGDRPTPTPRESRFKTPKKTKQSRPSSWRAKRKGDRPGRAVLPQPPPTQRRESAGRPILPNVSRSPSPGKSDRAWKGDLTGRRIAPRPATSRAKNVYPQPDNTNYSSTRSVKQMLRENRNPNVRRVQKMQDRSDEPRVGRPIRPTFHKTRPQRSERAWRGDITGRRIRAGSSDHLRPPAGESARRITGSQPPRKRGARVAPPSISGRAGSVSQERRFFVNIPSRSAGQRRSQMALYQLNRHYRKSGPAHRGRQIAPRSASAQYLARRSTNVWAHFPRPKRKGERAFTRDLAGNPLRTKNYQTPRPPLLNPTLQTRRPGSDRPYRGPAAGSHVSRTQSGRAWLGDIAHRAIRGGFRSKKGEPRAGSPIFGGGPGPEDRRVGRYQGNIRGGRRPVEDQGEGYTGNIRSSRQQKGGGSISGGWNNKGMPIRGRMPGRGADRIDYSGNIRAGKRFPREQGEEYTGNIRRDKRAFKDQGEEYTGNIPLWRKAPRDQGEEYTGNIRFRKPAKGGGSLSGKHWSNNDTPIQVRTPKGRGAGVGGYQGNIKARRKELNDQGEEYTGNIRARRRVFSNQGEDYTGNIRSQRRVFQEQGEEYAGNIRVQRPFKGGGSVSGRLWNNHERPIEGRAYARQTHISRYAGNTKARRPDKGGGSVSGETWNNNETAIEGRKYDGLTKLSRFSGQTKVSRNRYGKNQSAADEAIPVVKASDETRKAGSYSSGVRRDWDYIRNPSSADDAQKTREPGRAFARAGDFHGNIKVKKFDLFKSSDLHPDAQFVKINKNNVPEEKDMITNFKLWWARLFRKAETQPSHLKENDKDRKPRYDKGESGLWYD